MNYLAGPTYPVYMFPRTHNIQDYAESIQTVGTMNLWGALGLVIVSALAGFVILIIYKNWKKITNNNGNRIDKKFDIIFKEISKIKEDIGAIRTETAHLKGMLELMFRLESQKQIGQK